MSVTVTTSAGATQLDNGTDWGIDEGVLRVVDSTGSNVASFAPGVWQSAVVATP